MENHSNADIIGSSAAPFLNSLAAKGALFTQSFAVTHPSEPNYLALFSGSIQGLSDDSCPHSYSGANLGAELLASHLSFAGYSESLPRVGYTGCSAGPYARKHNPWTDFRNVPPEDNRPLTSWPSDFAALPTLSYVIPDLGHDMHDGSIQEGDAWLRAHLSGYASWAAGGHDSWLIITWDEDDGSTANHIPTLLVGAHVTPGRYAEHVTHYRLLRTVEDAFGLPHAGAAAAAAPITDVWH